MNDKSSERNIRALVVDWLSQSTIGSYCLTFLSTFWPFRSLRRNRRVIADELRALRNAASKAKPLSIVVDFNANFPGFGDFLVVVVLVNILEASGLRVLFFGIPVQGYSDKLDSNYPVIDGIRQQKMLALSRKLCKVDMTMLGSQSDVADLMDDPTRVMLFRDSLKQGLDFSQHCYGLINAAVLDPRLPVLAPLVRGALSQITSVGDVRYVGFHVRSSRFDTHRNPSLAVTLGDLGTLLSAFPNCEIRFFGDFSFFELLVGHLEGSDLERFKFQRSGNFEDATIEAIRSLFWFQRLGGGIGTGVMFSHTPYLVLSGDVPAIRLWKGNKRLPVSWRSDNQTISYAPFRAASKNVSHQLGKVMTKLDKPT